MSDLKAEQHWPCCSETQTQLFASVTGAGIPGIFHMEFDRQYTRRDLLWDRPLTVKANQRIGLSGQAAFVGKSLKPSWAPSYNVTAGGALSLAFFTTGGPILLEEGAIALNLTDCAVRFRVQLRGGVVFIARSTIDDNVQMLFSMGALDIVNTTMHAGPTFGADMSGAFVTISSSELWHWPEWQAGLGFSNSSTTAPAIISDVIVTLDVDLPDGRLAGILLGQLDTCGPGECEAGTTFVYACAAGFEGSDCLTDIDECAGPSAVTGEPTNGGCGHECVNTPGSYHCECFPGYYGVDAESTVCSGKSSAGTTTSPGTHNDDRHHHSHTQPYITSHW